MRRTENAYHFPARMLALPKYGMFQGNIETVREKSQQLCISLAVYSCGGNFYFQRISMQASYLGLTSVRLYMKRQHQALVLRV